MSQEALHVLAKLLRVLSRVSTQLTVLLTGETGMLPGPTDCAGPSCSVTVQDWKQVIAQNWGMNSKADSPQKSMTGS